MRERIEAAPVVASSLGLGNGPMTCSREQGVLPRDFVGPASAAEVMDSEASMASPVGPPQPPEVIGNSLTRRVLVSEPLQRSLEAARKNMFEYLKSFSFPFW